uniref:Retrotransposon protein, putative, Ty1-copia subclass n=1 Tax=Tanacetum cinerariifolium TaxID=118510 RepID=A0A699JB75_TANCI|nr:retrotransposon protein, putative, Ty1-copia subclass [Tanacetum cinerariifolium]
MDLWSGHPANYEMLRIFGCVAYSHVNQGKLKPRAIKCIFLRYPDGAGAADSDKEVEFKVELQGSRNLDNYVLVRDRAKRITSIPAKYRDEGNVSLFRPSGSKVDDMAAYAFTITEEEDTHEPITFQEVINSSNKDEWVRAMKKEMSSLMKNHTWEMVDQPSGQKLVSCKWLYKIKEGIEGVQKPSYLVLKKEHAIRFSRSNYDSCVYFKEFALGMYTYLLMYVDDMLIACKSKSEIEYTKGLLQKEFDMKKLGPAWKIFGMEIVKDRGKRTLKVSQLGYVQKILNNYRVDNGKSVFVPLGAHFKEAVKWILKYLKGTADVSLVYDRDQGKHMDIDGFVDADYAKDPDKGRSITGYVFLVHDCVVSWKATLQHVVALSTTGAEYMALTKAVKESIWLKGLLIELGVNLRSVVVKCDNQSAIHLSRNLMFHERTKHVNVRYHFIREIIESKEIEVAKMGTKDNAADAFTKVVPGLKFKYCMEIHCVSDNYSCY